MTSPNSDWTVVLACALFICAFGRRVGGADTTTPLPDPGGAVDSQKQLGSALQANAQATLNMTASTIVMMNKLENTVDKIVDSNNRNVDLIVQTSERLLDKWDSSLKPSVDELAGLASSALNTWDGSLKPSVDEITNLGKQGLARFDEVFSYIKSTIPLIVGIGCAWVGLCCLSSCICLASTWRSSFQSGGYYEPVSGRPAAAAAAAPPLMMDPRAMPSINRGAMRMPPFNPDAMRSQVWAKYP